MYARREVLGADRATMCMCQIKQKKGKIWVKKCQIKRNKGLKSATRGLKSATRGLKSATREHYVPIKRNKVLKSATK